LNVSDREKQRAQRAALAFAGLGLLIAVAIPTALFSGQKLEIVVIPWWRQASVAAVAVLAIAWAGAPRVAAKLRVSPDSLAPIWLGVESFVVGALVGCVTNLFVSGQFYLRGANLDYIFKPLFWLLTIGTPWSAFLGLLLGRQLRRIT
jgi:hypothetical protein